ncbi:MAG: MFS transporter [Burkholderiaceae bacterium]|nr:MFS transporter [Burkholderiaceae bacterium]
MSADSGTRRFPAAPRESERALWTMLLALTGGFALSQAYRTVAAIMAPQLQADFGLDPQGLGLFAGTFHFAFGLLQLLMGIGIDLYGVRRTVLVAFPLTIAGSLLSAVTSNFGVLLLAQALIGIGCAPAFLVCTVFIAKRFPAARYASVSGLVLGLGGMGMLATGTPLAWLIEASSWRTGFVALAAFSALAWLAIARFVHERASADEGASPAERESIGQALHGFASLFAMPHTWGILALATVSYAAFVSLRGLWLGPLLVDRYGFSLVASGNVAIAVSVASMIGPPLFGRLDPGRATRRRWLLAGTLVCAAMFALLAPGFDASFDVIVAIAFSLVSGYGVLQYADVRDAYPASMTGRALSLFTMALFLGVALMQWLTGAVASAAVAHGLPPFAAAFATIALMLAAGALLFVRLPQPR